ncbi:hypothetical protein D3C78_1588750 [compost metagenome]
MPPLVVSLEETFKALTEPSGVAASSLPHEYKQTMTAAIISVFAINSAFLILLILVFQ